MSIKKNPNPVYLNQDTSSHGGLPPGLTVSALSWPGAKLLEETAFYRSPKCLPHASPLGFLQPVWLSHQCSMRAAGLSASLPQTKGKITVLACIPQTSPGYLGASMIDLHLSYPLQNKRVCASKQKVFFLLNRLIHETKAAATFPTAETVPNPKPNTYILLRLNIRLISHIRIIKVKFFLGFWYLQINTNQYFHPVPSNHSSYRCSLSTISLQTRKKKKKKKAIFHVSRSVLIVVSAVSHTVIHSPSFEWST